MDTGFQVRGGQQQVGRNNHRQPKPKTPTNPAPPTVAHAPYWSIHRIFCEDDIIKISRFRAASLEANSGMFQQNSQKLRKKYWYQ